MNDTRYLCRGRRRGGRDMERLTWYDRYGGAYADAGSVKIEEYDTAMVATGEAIVRLAAYEDTGLTPEEVAALRAQLEPDGWISVENQLPDAKGHYLTIGKINWAHGGSGEGNDGDARRNMIISYFDSTGMFNHPHTTHWRPLPEPPREGKI